MSIVTVICNLLVFSFFAFEATGQYIDPDAGLTITELVEKHGYPIESHTVQTQDNYLLTTHRIPHGVNDIPGVRKVVLLVHGLLGSSADWLDLGPDTSLGFKLADAGFDVWLVNVRGNQYSRAHRFLDPFFQAQQFFDFSFHEIGLYDLTANIDYILQTTGQTKLSYIGYSQGGSSFYAMASERSSYMSKIKGVVLMAPATFMTNSEAPVILAGATLYPAVVAVGLITPEFLRYNKTLSDVLIAFCGTALTNDLCASALFAVYGFDFAQLEPSTMSLVLSFTPAGGSVKQLEHYAQLKKTSNFQQFDYGILENPIRYGLLHLTPPSYDLRKNTRPTTIYYGSNDWLVVPEDVQRLADTVQNLIALKPVSNPDWTHGDFMYGKDVGILVNDAVVNDIISYG